MVQAEELAATYRQNQEVRRQLKALGALAYIPADKIVEAYEELAASADPLVHDVYAQFERNFIGKQEINQTLSSVCQC